MKRPIISIVMAAYNRADTIGRAIESVLHQDMYSWELIIVDDGSTDSTREVMRAYAMRDARIRLAFHPKNMHVHATKNTGFDLMRGEWFTTLDSDDEMVPTALSRMLGLLDSVDPNLDAITCNCLDTRSGNYSGKGLDKSQYLDFRTLASSCSGEFWGLTKRSLLGNNRLNQEMRGSAETILWWKIGKYANRYYLHEQLRVYHTEGSDRICQELDRKVILEDRINYYLTMSNELEFLANLRQYRPVDYGLVQRNIALCACVKGHRGKAWTAYSEGQSYLPIKQRILLAVAVIGGKKVGEVVLHLGLRARKSIPC
jgi:glycosyltransferase involved in cell wall biosynthesis